MSTSAINFYELVPHLLNLYPDWTEGEIFAFVEEKLRKPLHPEDLTTVRAIYLRHLLLEREFR